MFSTKNAKNGKQEEEDDNDDYFENSELLDENLKNAIALRR